MFFGLITLAIPFLLVPYSLTFISTSELAIFLSSIPLFVLVLARIFLKEKITFKKWLGFFTGPGSSLEIPSWVSVEPIRQPIPQKEVLAYIGGKMSSSFPLG